MTLAQLAAENFRCFASFELHPDSSRNLIIGPNGAGKTSVLEAVYFLGRGRSFRGGESSGIRREGSRFFTLAGQVDRPPRQIRVGLRVQPGVTEARIDGRDVAGLAELATLLPVQIIEPGAHKLIEEGPARRRRFLDWGVFHVEPRFLDAWRRYQRALRQRNAGLKQGLPDAALQGFEATLIESGETVGRFRARHVEGLRPRLDASARQLLETTAVECDYLTGWPAGKSLAEAVEEGRAGDRRNQTTRLGPHRADLQLRVHHRAARERVSRGEQKLLAASLILAQIDLLSETREPGLLLIDDPAAELDSDSLQRLLEAVLSRPAQLYVTALDARIPLLREHARVIGVEQGKLVEMV